MGGAAGDLTTAGGMMASAEGEVDSELGAAPFGAVGGASIGGMSCAAENCGTAIIAKRAKNDLIRKPTGDLHIVHPCLRTSPVDHNGRPAAIVPLRTDTWRFRFGQSVPGTPARSRAVRWRSASTVSSKSSINS